MDHRTKQQYDRVLNIISERKESTNVEDHETSQITIGDVIFFQYDNLYGKFVNRVEFQEFAHCGLISEITDNDIFFLELSSAGVRKRSLRAFIKNKKKKILDISFMRSTREINHEQALSQLQNLKYSHVRMAGLFVYGVTKYVILFFLKILDGLRPSKARTCSGLVVTYLNSGLKRIKLEDELLMTPNRLYNHQALVNVKYNSDEKFQVLEPQN